MSYRNRNVPWLPRGRERWRLHPPVALFSRTIPGRRTRRLSCRARGVGGREGAKSLIVIPLLLARRGSRRGGMCRVRRRLHGTALFQQQAIIRRGAQQAALVIQSVANRDSGIGGALPALSAILALEN